MKLVSFQSGSNVRPGLVVDAGIFIDVSRSLPIAQKAGLVDNSLSAPASVLDIINGQEAMLAACEAILRHAGDDRFADTIVSSADVTLVAPIPRPAKNVFCVGSNYRAHVTEASRAQKKEDKTPKLPVFFTKPPTAVVGPEGAVLVDPDVSVKIDYEVELAVVFGKSGRNISQADAVSHIFGFTIINDVTARDLQRAHGGQFLKGKGLDTTCPMGPHIVTIDELPNFDNLRISLTVNGETRQHGNTRDMIFPIPHLIESLSAGLTLEPGDLLATGTPSGVGYAMDPPHWLTDGDVVTCEIEGIGTLSNSIRQIGKEAAGKRSDAVAAAI